MSHEEAHGHAAASSGGTSELFTPEECAAMHADDVHAAKGVVLLMVSVFSIGLVLYLFIALTL